MRKEDFSGYELLTKNKAAQLLGISSTSLWRAIKKGDIKLVRIGNSDRIPFSEIIRFQQTHNEN